VNGAAWLGWALAAIAIALGYARFGWQGAVLGITIVVFWLLLQFSRAMRVMRIAGQSPVGQVDNAVMLNARLKPGLRLIDILKLTRSLGERVAMDEGADTEQWRWADSGGAQLIVTFRRGRCVAHEVRR